MEDKKKKTFSLRKRLDSMKYAVNGLRILIKEEHNARIHLAISAIVIILGFFLHISTIEWLIICLTIALVISLEAVNSALENLADHVSPKYSDLIKKSKDLSAGAVLFAAIVSVIIGTIIFLPKLIELFLQ